MNQTFQLGDTQVDGPSLAEVCRRYGVKELALFGSAVRGEMRPESDIDIMVEFEPGVRIGLIKFGLCARIRGSAQLVAFRAVGHPDDGLLACGAW